MMKTPLPRKGRLSWVLMHSRHKPAAALAPANLAGANDGCDQNLLIHKSSTILRSFFEIDIEHSLQKNTTYSSLRMCNSHAASLSHANILQHDVAAGILIS